MIYLNGQSTVGFGGVADPTSSLIGVTGIERTTSSFRAALIRTAQALGIDPDYLATVISFETGGSFSPSQKNLAGSSAVGLIQFTEVARVMLGVSRNELMAMSAEEQLDYVRQYFVKHGFAPSKSRTLDDVYFAVFWPDAIGKSSETVLMRRGSSEPCAGTSKTQDECYRLNAGFDTAQKGYITAGDVSVKIREWYGAGLRRPRVAALDEGPTEPAEPVAKKIRATVVVGAALGLVTLTAYGLYRAFRLEPEFEPPSPRRPHPQRPPHPPSFRYQLP